MLHYIGIVALVGAGGFAVFMVISEVVKHFKRRVPVASELGFSKDFVVVRYRGVWMIVRRTDGLVMCLDDTEPEALVSLRRYQDMTGKREEGADAKDPEQYQGDPEDRRPCQSEG